MAAESMQPVDRTSRQERFSLECFASVDLEQDCGEREEPWYCGLDFMPDGRLIAVDCNNKKCVVYNQQLEAVSTMYLSYRPLDVAVFSNEQFIITSGYSKKLYRYIIDESGWIDEARPIDVSVICDSISMVDRNTVCVGTVYSKDSVLFLSLQGEPRNLGLNFPNESFYNSACAYLQNIAKIVFPDSSSDTVYIQDIATNQLVTVRDEVIKGPSKITSGPDDSIFITCIGNNSVVQITQTGQVLGSYTIDIELPSSICSSPDRSLLAVSNSRTRKKLLRVYRIERN